MPDKPKARPAGGYHPKKTNEWGAVLGILVAFVLALLLLHRGIRFVAINYQYFDAHIQHEIQLYEDGE